MDVEEIMSTAVVTVEMDDSVMVIKEIFDHSKFHHLLVLESEKLFGVISDRDLLKVLSPNIGTPAETTKDLVCLNKKAHQIMTRNIHTLEESAEINDAIDIFMNYNISCIPVLNNKGRPVGMISWRDILKAIALHRHNT